MTQKRVYIAAAIGLLMATQMQAQSLNSAYFTEDYKYRHTMNPAWDNEQSYVSLPALGNLHVRTQGNFGYDAVILNNPLAGQSGQKSMTTFLNPYISSQSALDGFSRDNNRIVGNINLAVLSAGFKAFGGYNTIELNSKSSFGISLPYELLEFAKNTGNRTYDIGDVSAGALSYIELALGHSRRVTDKLRVGGKLKVLLGVGRADVKLENMKAELDDANRWIVHGKAVADVSMKRFEYKEGTKDYKSDSRGSYRRVNGFKIKFPGVSGLGLAFDLGAAYQINSDWTISAALLDLGFISWSNDMQARNISDGFEFNGFHDVAVTSKRPGEYGTIERQTDKYADQIADFINVQDQGDQGRRTTGIGATFNAAAEYKLPVYRKLSFGLLSSTRLNGDFSWTEARLSANWKPLSWLDGGVNAAIGSFSASMGWVLNIHPKGFNFFLGMDHILGKLSKEGIPLSSNASVALGMNITW